MPSWRSEFPPGCFSYQHEELSLAFLVGQVCWQQILWVFCDLEVLLFHLHCRRRPSLLSLEFWKLTVFLSFWNLKCLYFTIILGRKMISLDWLLRWQCFPFGALKTSFCRRLASVSAVEKSAVSLTALPLFLSVYFGYPSFGFLMMCLGGDFFHYPAYDSLGFLDLRSSTWHNS